MSPTNVVTWMPESSSFTTPLESQRVHVSQTLPKSAPQHFYPNFPFKKRQIELENI